MYASNDMTKKDDLNRSKSTQPNGNTKPKTKAKLCETPLPIIGEKLNQEQNESPTDVKSVIGSRCISILGFDIMIDAKLKPHLIEVNHLPSFGADSPMDESIKSKVVYQALSVFKASASDQCIHESNEKSRRDNRLYGKVNELNESNLRLISEPVIHDNSDGRDKDLLLSTSSDSVVGSSIEENITEIYVTYAPEKVNKSESVTA